MRTANDPLRRAERLHVRLLARAEEGPQLVYLSLGGKVEFCPPEGARHRALALDAGFARRVAGVFDGRASVALLAASLREVARCS
jgi:hypothetical protein